MTSSTLLFEAGIMKISDYDPVKDSYQIRTLQLPSLPFFDDLEMPLFTHGDNRACNNDTNDNHKSSVLSAAASFTPLPSSCASKPSLSTLSSSREPVRRKQSKSRFVECFEIVDTFMPVTSDSLNTQSANSTLRSKSISAKKSPKSPSSAKAPRRCYSNPNLSKKNNMMMAIEPLDPTLVANLNNTKEIIAPRLSSTSSSSSSSSFSSAVTSPSNAPKRSLSNAFHVLSGLLPKNNKRRLNAIDQEQHYRRQQQQYSGYDEIAFKAGEVNDDDDAGTTHSSSSTIRQAWLGTTWMDQMKVSSDEPRQRLSSREQTGSWWIHTTGTPLLPTSDVCV